MTVTADVPAAFRRRGSIPDAYGWDGLAVVLELTGDANHIHIPGSPLEWKHPYVPLAESAARSHGHGKVPKGWKAPGGGGKGKTTAPATRKAADKLTAAAKPSATAKAMPAGDLKAADQELARRAALLGKPGQQSRAHKAVTAEIAKRAAAGGGERPNTIVQPDPVTGNLREMTQKETAEAAGRYAQTLRPGSAERGEIERQAMDIARGGPTWQRMKADADALRPLVGKTGAPGSPKPDKELSFSEVQDAYQAAHGRPAPKSMLRSWAFNGPSGQDKRSDWYQAGVKRKGEMQAQGSLRARLLDARPDDVKAREDAAEASARADIRAVQQSGSRAAAAARAAAAKPKAPRAPRVPAPKKSAADKLSLISERMSGGDKTSGDMQAGDMLQGHQAISQAPAGIIGGTSDPWWMAGPNGSFGLSVKGSDGQRQFIPWGAEKQKEAEAAAVKAVNQHNRYGVGYGSGYQQVLAKAVASRAHYQQLGFARTWDDLDLVIDLAVRAPAGTPDAKAAKAKTARSGLAPGSSPVSRGAAPAGQRQAPASLAASSPRRGRQVPLTPMRQAAAKSMRKLAASVQESHPDMTVHDHLRDAARTLESGQEEASQRHLRAAMFALTPQSLMRNGLHTDDHHTAGRQVMHSVHRHLLLVRDIADVGVKNREAVARLGSEDETAPRPPADPNNGYGPGALAQKPTARQPGGDRALNAPNRSSSGGSDPAVADPDGPQRPGSKQFAYGWDDLDALLEFSARTAQLEVTPAPIGKPGGPGLYHVKGLGHSAYFEQVRNGLMKRGIPEGTAHAMTWGILRRWAAGGGGVHPEVRAAAVKALAEEKAKGALAHAHAVTWEDISGDIGLSSVIDFAAAQPASGSGAASSSSGSPQARVPAGQAGGGRFGSGSGQPTAGKPDAHQQHVAHVAHVAQVSTAKAALMATAQDDKAKAAGLITQRNALQKALASAGGKVSSGQAGAKTATTAKTKSTAPATAGTAAAPAASTTTAKAPAAAKTPAKAATTAAPGTAAAKATAAQLTQQIGALNTQINQLLAAAKQAAAQAAAMK